MATSRASSPANDSMSSSPSQLTPRSKVRAMLAALDDDSDDGSNHTSKKPDFLSKPGSLGTLETHKECDVSNPTKNTSIADYTESEEEDVVFKPRGRIAARMLNVQPSMEGDRNGEDQTETARDRVRKFLTAEANNPSRVQIEEGQSDSSDDRIKPVVSRKRKIRRARETTPSFDGSKTKEASPAGMFVSPASNKSPNSARDAQSSEDELPANPTASARFLALVEKKRQERIARESEIHRRKAEKAAERARLSGAHSTLLEDDGTGYSDDDGGQKLTQQARPTRKASKKALEEMHRETQRMSRNMQLAHEARTKKKITKSDLFARFNYKPAGFVGAEVVEQARPASSSSAPYTENETRDTPPTSPMSHTNSGEKLANLSEDGEDAHPRDISMVRINSEEDIPTLHDAVAISTRSSPPPLTTRSSKGKGKAAEELELPTKVLLGETIESAISSALPQVRPPKVALKTALAGNDSDSDLEIVANQTPTQKTKVSVFDRIPVIQARESNPLQALRLLAHVGSPGKRRKGRNAKPSLTANELQMSLQQRARQQAVREREERLQALRDKGVIVQTAEEREREMADMEDLMAKARREGEEIMKREKDAAKKQRKANGEIDPLGESSDDEEWKEEKEKFEEQLSGSESGSDDNDKGDASNEEEEDEEDDDEAMSMDEENSGLAISKPAGPFVDDEASEDDTNEGEISEQDPSVGFADDGGETSDGARIDEAKLPTIQARRRTKHLVVSDDEDEQSPDIQSSVLPRTESPLFRNAESPIAPPSVLRSATKTFIPGLTVAGPAGLGLTQIFRGTMDDSQMSAFEGSPSTQSQPLHELDTAQDSLAFLRNLPGPDLPAFAPTMDEDTQDIVRDSQTQVSHVPESPISGAVSQQIHLDFSQSQIYGFDSMPQNPPGTQFSEFPEPTQDGGFQAISPIKGRYVELPPSTIDTVILQQTPVPDCTDEPPIIKKKGKLRRRIEMSINSGDEQEKVNKAPLQEDIDHFEISDNVFDVMRKASKRKEREMEGFDKKKSRAKDMVQEQAEESEDEYAGLGGASDDESGGEADAYVKEIIDDEDGKDVDERKLAAFYADKERASDEKQVEKLFKDITNGMLRRRRGADYDLSDSDDGGEARRRMRRAQEAQLRKALLEDERIGKIAENPKKIAFLRAIEDRGGDDEMDFLDDLDDADETMGSQSQSRVDASQEVLHVSDSQPNTVMGPPKRKLPHDSEIENRLPPHLRRTKPAKRPANLSEIRESLSSLIEEPNVMMASHESSSSDSEQERDDSGTSTRRNSKDKENRDPFASRRTDSMQVVDRISLKRSSSSNVSLTTRLAFAAPSSTSGFKVPALLKRTTTNSSISSGSSTSGVSGTERMAGGFGDESKFTRKAGKNSGVNYFARENERKMKVLETEKRRKEKRWKGAEGRRKVVGGLFGIGKFE